jgi:hypothetical protein
MGFCGRASSSSGNECSRPQGSIAGHAYPENGSPRVVWMDARVTPGSGQMRKQASWFSGVARSIQCSGMKSTLRVTLAIRFF